MYHLNNPWFGLLDPGWTEGGDRVTILPIFFPSGGGQHTGRPGQEGGFRRTGQLGGRWGGSVCLIVRVSSLLELGLPNRGRNQQENISKAFFRAVWVKTLHSWGASPWEQMGPSQGRGRLSGAGRRQQQSGGLLPSPAPQSLSPPAWKTQCCPL